MTQSTDRVAAATGTLRETPFCHLLIYVYRRSSSGTLVLAHAAGQALIAFTRGRPTRARVPWAAHDLSEALLPLCGEEQGTFAFFDEDLLAGVLDAIAGNVDPYTLLAASLSGHAREDVIQNVLQRYRGSRLRLPPHREIERLRLDPIDQQLLELIRAAPATPEELLAQSPLGEERTRRLIYALIVTQMVVPHDEQTQQTVVTNQTAGGRPSLPSRKSSAAWQILAGLRPDLSGRVDSPYSLRPETSSAMHTTRSLRPAGDSSPAIAASLRPSSPSLSATSSSLIPETDIPARIRRVKQLLPRGRYDDALTDIDAMLRMEPERADLYGVRAHALFEKHSHEPGGLPRSVLEALKRALEIDPDETTALYVRGLVCKQGGDLKKACAYFKRVLQVDASHLEAQRELRLAKLRGA
jgi:tetratricopeptide (TPR) repeat protein